MSKRPSSCDAGGSDVKKKKYATSFRPEYTVDFPCIVKGKDLYSARCTICFCEFSVGYGGRDDVKRHVTSKKHTTNSKASCDVKPISSMFSSKTSPVDEAVIRAETLFTSFLLEHNIALSASDHASKLFKSMFLVDGVQPKDIIKRYSCARTKSTAIVKELASDARSSLIDRCKILPFSIATDGSNDKTDKLYPLLVICPGKDGLINCELLSLLELKDKSTGKNIAHIICEELKKHEIPIQNCISLCTDNARSMIGEENGLYGRLLNLIPNLYATGCPCHRLHLSAEWASKELSFNPEPFFLDIYYYVEKSANRFQAFQECQQNSGTAVTKIPKHVPTRWLSLGKMTKWILEQWDALTDFFQKECDMDKKEGGKTSDRKRHALDNLKSRMAKLTLMFLNFVIPIFDKANCQLQSEAPLVHKLKRILCSFIKELMTMFVKPCAMLYKTVTEVDIKSSYNLKDPKNIPLGETANQYIISANIPEDKVEKFRLGVRNFLKVAVGYALSNFKLDDKILINAEVADIQLRTTASFRSVHYFLDRFNHMMPPGASTDEVQKEFMNFQVDSLTPDITDADRADRQWQEIALLKDEMGTLKYKFLPKVMLAILSIPHSNASCERLFSAVRKNRTDYRGSLKVETIGDILLAKQSGTECYNTNLTPALLKKCKSATYNAKGKGDCES